MAESIVVLCVEGDVGPGERFSGRLEGEDADFEVLTETDVEGAVGRLSGTHVDCVVSGYELPDADGLELLERVRETHPDLPFVLFPTEGSERVASDAFSKGATEYVRRGRDDAVARLAETVRDTVRGAREGMRRMAELERYEVIVEAMGDGVYVTDAEGEYVQVNDQMEEMLGYDAERLYEEGASLVLDEEEIDRFHRTIGDLLSDSDDRRVATVESEHERADGTVAPIEVTVTLRPMPDGEFRGTIGVVREISEHKERERELERYQTLLDVMPDTVVVTDLEGTHLDIHGFEGWSGYEYEELVGEPFSKTIPDEDAEKIRDVVTELVLDDERTKATIEHDIVTKDGERVPFENHLTLLPEDETGDVTGTMSVLRNVSERKARERELERQNERLEEFASVVSHDLRNPLNVATGRLDLAREECDSDHLDTVRRSLDRMEALIDDILTMARQGESALEPERVDLGQTAESCWDAVASADATLDVDVDATIEADEGQLRQLFENLLRNAVEHGGDDVTVRVGSLSGGFYVADDGPGIPPEDRETVFDSGYTTSEDGTGFGLAIVREVADAHGWDLTVTESEMGGARFEVRGVSVAE